jgi:hypothetical protein
VHGNGRGGARKHYRQVKPARPADGFRYFFNTCHQRLDEKVVISKLTSTDGLSSTTGERGSLLA